MYIPKIWYPSKLLAVLNNSHVHYVLLIIRCYIAPYGNMKISTEHTWESTTIQNYSNNVYLRCTTIFQNTINMIDDICVLVVIFFEYSHIKEHDKIHKGMHTSSMSKAAPSAYWALFVYCHTHLKLSRPDIHNESLTLPLVKTDIWCINYVVILTYAHLYVYDEAFSI